MKKNSPRVSLRERLSASERLSRGIDRLALLSHLLFEYAAHESLNRLSNRDHLTLASLLEDITTDLEVGHRDAIAESNELYELKYGSPAAIIRQVNDATDRGAP